MDRVTYKLTIGPWSVDSADDARTELIELETLQSLDAPNDRCRIVLYPPPAPGPGGVEALAGAAAGDLGLGGGAGGGAAFSVAVRGKKIRVADRIVIELRVGDRQATVMTAAVQSLQSSLGEVTIVGRTGLQTLAGARLNQVYQNQTLRKIVQDLAGQAGVETGDVETGSTYPYFIVAESRSLLAQLRALGRREGADLYFDPDNRLTLRRFTKASADHTLQFGRDILELQLLHHAPTSEQVRVYGESPASRQGLETWPWLVKDLSPFQGEAGRGARRQSIHDGAARTKDAADRLARATSEAMLAGATLGRVKTLGNPGVKLGDALAIRDAPRPELNGVFKITSTRHLFGRRHGYVTLIDFSGRG